MSKNTGTSELINYFDLGANGDVGIAGSLDINTIANATTDTDKFLVSDTGIIKYRTGTQLLSDIGAAPAVAGGYVPYTGATTNVDLGVYNLTTSAIIANGSGSNSGIVHLESNAIHSLVNGYGSIASGTTNQFNFYQTTGAGVFRGAILSLNSITASATRTFTLPDTDGTIALTSQIPANAVGGTGTTNYLPKFTGSTTIGNSALQETSGNLGLGVTPSAWSVIQAMQILNTSWGASPNNLILYQSSNVFFDGAFKYITTGTASQYRINDNGVFSWLQAPSGTAGNAISFTQAMTLTSGGNLGLGVTPSAWANGFTALQVRNASIWSTGNDASFTANAYYDGSNYRFIGNAGASRVYHNTDGSIGWSQVNSGTAGNTISFTQAMTLTSGGNLLVGTTTDNGARLQVSGYGSFTVTGDNTRAIRVIGPTNRTGYLGHAFGTLFIQNNNYFNGSAYVFDDTSIGCANVTLGQDIGFQTGAANTNPTTKVYITNAGNVGIGTISPASNLQVASSSSPVIAMNLIGSATSGPRGDLAWYNSSISTVALIRATAVTDNVGTQLEFYTRPVAGSLTQAMTITSSGNVGIGTTTDGGYKLDVAGTIRSLSATPLVVSMSSNPANDAIVAARWTSGLGMDMTYHPNSAVGFIQNTYPVEVNQLFGDIQFRNSIGGTMTSRMIIKGHSGNVGINTTTPTAKFHVFGTARFDDANGIIVASNTQYRQIYFDGFSNLYFWNGSNQSYLSSAGTWVNASDISIKKDIKEIKYALSDLLKLKPKSYKMVDTDLEQIGFIAQDVENIIPELVGTDNKEMKSLNYGNMVALLVKAIQEQQIQIQELKNKLS